MAVVIQATEIATMCSDSARRAHSLRSAVSAMVCRTLASTCTALATARMEIISGASTVTEFSAVPVHPSEAMPLSAEMTITTRVISTPAILRSITPTISNMTTNITGVSVWPSS